MSFNLNNSTKPATASASKRVELTKEQQAFSATLADMIIEQYTVDFLVNASTWLIDGIKLDVRKAIMENDTDMDIDTAKAITGLCMFKARSVILETVSNSVKGA